MENIIAIRVEFEDQPTRYLLTWGRIQDPVDPRPIETLVARIENDHWHARVVSCTVCDSLQAAAHARYFFECLFDMAQHPIPFGDEYNSWVVERDQAVREGRELWDCGAIDS